MKRRYMVLAAVTMLGSACASRTVQESTGDVEMGAGARSGAGRGADFKGIEGWNALRGSVYARPVGTKTQVSLTIEGGIPGSRYAWDIREGTCGSGGPVLPTEQAYMVVDLGDRGMGSTIVDVPTGLAPDKDYSVSLYGSATERTLVIGCGRLSR